MTTKADLRWVEIKPAPGAKRTWVLTKDGKVYCGELEDFETA